MHVYTICVQFKIWQDDYRPQLWQGEGKGIMMQMRNKMNGSKMSSNLNRNKKYINELKTVVTQS